MRSRLTLPTEQKKITMPKKYLCIQRSEPSGPREKPSPAQMEAMYARFHTWKERFQKNIVDLGGRLGGAA